MKFYDISLAINPDMVLYPGNPPVSITREHETTKGDNFTTSALSFGSHTGTHVDAPFHVNQTGPTVDKLPLEAMIGKAVVADVAGVDEITAARLAGLNLPQGTQRLILKTQDSRLWRQSTFQTNYAYITEDGAEWLVDQGIRLIGIDYLSVEQFDPQKPVVHRKILGAGIVVLEGLDLGNVPPGEYFLACLPLKIKDGDGAPARAVLVEDL